METEQYVSKLLKAGVSERQVAEKAGITRRQVRNIKDRLHNGDADDDPFAFDMRPTISRKEAISELVKLSTRREGLRNSEMSPILRAFYGLRLDEKSGAVELNMTDNQLRYLKEQTKTTAISKGKEALFIPEWLPRSAPRAATAMLTMAAHDLHERAQEYASEIVSAFPDVSRSSVFHELVSLSFSQACPEPVITRCERNKETADRLQMRLAGLVRMPAANDPLVGPPVMSDPELERICL